MRFEVIEGVRVEDQRDIMAREVRAGLLRSPRSIAPKYFYDDTGSRLFDAICDLPEYYLTRSERALLERYADEIVARSGAAALVEIGSGMARKTGLLVRALCARAPSPRYVPFDIAASAIAESARSLLPVNPRLAVHGVVGDFMRDLQRVALGAPPSAGPRLFAFLGSTLGNLDEVAAPALLGAIARLMKPVDRFLLGVDLVKDTRVLEAAYNDAQGITAAFNKNVLHVLARELDGDFDARAFDHLAFYDSERERIEMHLVSTRRQSFALRAIDLRFDLREGERVMTEISRKFTRSAIARTLGEGGMAIEHWLPDEKETFALVVATRADCVS